MDTSRVRELKTWPPPPLDAGLYRVDRSSRELNATFGPSSSPLCMFALLSPQHLSTLLSVASVPISPPELYLAFSSQGNKLKPPSRRFSGIFLVGFSMSSITLSSCCAFLQFAEESL